MAACALVLGATGCEEISARRTIQEGNKAYREEKYDDAIASFEKALAANPSPEARATALFNLAIAHVDLYTPGNKAPENEKHATGAIESLSKYLELKPTDETARKLLIGIYTKSGRYEGALAWFESEFQKNPKDPYNVAQLADINKQAQRFDDARKWYEKLAEIEDKPDTKSNAWQQLGVTYFQQLNNRADVVGEERVKLADAGIGALARAIELKPDDPNPYIFTNLLYRQRSLGQGKSYVAVVDLATANKYQKKALELKGMTPTGQPAKAGEPAKADDAKPKTP